MATSYTLENVYASLPRTTRGYGIVLGSDPKVKNFLYVNGNSVYMRNIANPVQCDVYTEHSTQVNVAKYSPSGFYIASADQSGKVRIWDTVNKEHILKNEFQPISGPIKDLQWSSDNQRLIVGGEGREQFGHVFNAETGTSVGEIMGMSRPINSVDFKPTRPFRAVTASEDNTISYFEGPPFKFKKSMAEHDRFVNTVRFSPNGEKFASGGADGRLLIFDGKNGDKLSEIGKPAHAGSIYALAWDETSRKLATASGDRTLKIWDVEAGKLFGEFKFGAAVEEQQLGCLWTSGGLIVSVSLSGAINYLEVSPSGEVKLVRVVKGHSKSISALEVATFGTGQKIVSASHDGVIAVWDAVTGDAQLMSGHSNQVQSLSVFGGTKLVSCALDDSVRFGDVSEAKFSDEIKLDAQPQGLAHADNGVTVVACVNKLLILRDGRNLATVAVAFEATCVAAMRSGRHFAVGSKDAKVHVYELTKEFGVNAVKTLNERGAVSQLAYSPDEKFLAVADSNKVIKCYRVTADDYEDVTREMWQHHAARVTSLSWAPDSKHLASTSVDTHVWVYSPESIMSYVQIKSAHPLNPVTASVWLDSNHLLTGGQDSCIRKWKFNF